MQTPITYTPIGLFQTVQKYPYQAPRQPDEKAEPGCIVLNAGFNFEQALQDLQGCSHLWIVYDFHHNKHWKPLVQTPRSDRKIGVFATRAPYRPNSIGLTVCSLLKIEGLKIFVGPNDLLEGTPILDLKPYHPESDCIAEASMEWLEHSVGTSFQIRYSPTAEQQLDFLESHGFKELRPFLHRQLEYDPLNKNKKRVRSRDSIIPGLGITGHSVNTLSYRTWRIDFIIVDDVVSILSVYSGYTKNELQGSEDPYHDKFLHRLFIQEFT